MGDLSAFGVKDKERRRCCLQNANGVLLVASLWPHPTPRSTQIFKLDNLTNK